MATATQCNVFPYPPANVQMGQMQMANNVDNANLSKIYVMKIRATAILTLICGVLMVLLGIAAMIIWGYWSYFAVPLWCGIGFFVVTGSIGIKASNSRARSSIKAYIVMSTISCVMSAGLVSYYCLIAIFEVGGYNYHYGGYYWECQPGGEDTYEFNCPKSQAARITVDSLIAVVSFVLFFVTLVAASYGCCATCLCCKTTCLRCCIGCCGEGCAKCCCGGGGCESCCSSTPPATFAFNGNLNGQIQGGIQPQSQPVMFIIQPSQSAQYPHASSPSGAVYLSAGAPGGVVYPQAPIAVGTSYTPGNAPGGAMSAPGGASAAQAPVHGNPALPTTGSHIAITTPTPAQPQPPQYQAIGQYPSAGQQPAAQLAEASYPSFAKPIDDKYM